MAKNPDACGMNWQIARRLDEVAQLLSKQGANHYRIQAYRNAAANLARLERPIDEVLKEGGEPALRRIRGIGPSIARAIGTLILTGRLPMLDRLRGESEPTLLLASVPGIGKVLGARLHDELGIHTLEQLEVAAHDGRLRDLLGLGDKRIAGIMDSLASRLGRLHARPPSGRHQEPSVTEILDVDREYRERAARGILPTVAPRRFNPTREAWLPILHTNRGERHYTVMFSNTSRAHKLNKNQDWVIVYYDGDGGDRQYTVITSQHLPFFGKRIVRGREDECAEYYRSAEPAAKLARETNTSSLRLASGAK
jgi:predicted flap endonuclease-1-like 5' DNA nuclease